MELSAYFVAGRDGRPIGRVRGMKIMLPVAGIKPQAGREYKVKVIRDTRPDERGGALLVEVLEDLDEKWERERDAAQAQAAIQRVERVDNFLASLRQEGINPPPREDLIRITAEDNPAFSLSMWDARIRPLIERANPPAVPPTRVREAAARWLEIQSRPRPQEPRVPDMNPWEMQLVPDHVLLVKPWGHSPLDGALVFDKVFPKPDLPRLERVALRVKASIKRDGTRTTEFLCGFMVPVSVDAGPSPDEMGRRYSTEWAFQYTPYQLDDEQRAAAEKIVPWPSEEALAAYWEAVASHETWKEEMKRFEEDRAREARPFEQTVKEWVDSLTSSERLFLPKGDEALIRHCAR